MRAGIEMKCSTQGGGVSGVGSEVVVDPLSGEGRGTMSVIQNMVIDTDIDFILKLIMMTFHAVPQLSLFH